MMRVTQSMLNSQFLYNLQNNLEQMQKYQNQMATGKRINTPSDDPIGASFLMRYEAELGRNQQYKRNIDAARSNLEATDSTLEKINGIMQRVRTLAVQGANDSYSTESRQAIVSELNQLYSQLVNLGNTRFNGKSLFNGQLSDVDPYTEANAPNVNTDTKETKVAVGDGVVMATNLTGDKVFGKDVTVEADNAFAVIKNLIAALNANNATAISQTIGQIDSRLSKINQAWAEVGARLNRLELIANRTDETILNLNKLSSDIGDADIAEVISNLKQQENVYRSALAVGARILPPTLVDFLK